MLDDRIPTVPELVEYLNAQGVQIWHNRGRLYAGPLKQVDGDMQKRLAAHKAEIIGYLKRFPPRPRQASQLVAPRDRLGGAYAGRCTRKPWDYELAVILPNLNCRDLLDAALACWRHQTVTPYLVVIDTGSDWEEWSRLEELRSYDLEVHYIAGHGWRHCSSPVAAALDLGFALCQQRYALLTHVDVFPKRFDVLEELLPLCTPSCPVVGYQVSPRGGSDEWRTVTSHALTLVDLQAMRRGRITWNLLTALEQDDEVEQRYFGWPDTETQFGRSLHAAGIVPQFLGPEPNARVYENEHLVHWRSLPSVRHYLPIEAQQRYPGLADWLARTRELGRAAPLPTSGGQEP